jgi:hypothetical protein
LDLSHNPIEDDTIVPLLLMFEGAENIKLQRLNLNGTRMRDETAEAMGSLLSKNRTLVSLGFASQLRDDDFFLKPLVLALEHNTFLLRLEVSFHAVGAWRIQMDKHLTRNRGAFKMALANGMRHGVSVLLESLLGSLFYADLAHRVIDVADFSYKDALALSSLHPTVWAERHKAPQADDPST